MMPRIQTAKVRQPTFNRNAGAQTKRMPMVAIESHHMDCVHGPIIVSPLDLLNVDDRNSNEVSGKKTKATQTDFEQLNPPVADKQSKAAQTDFTSFTRPTHYYLPNNYFDKYLIVESCEDLDSQEITERARAFNLDFLTRFGYLFPVKFMISYFGLMQRQSNL